MLLQLVASHRLPDDAFEVSEGSAGHSSGRNSNASCSLQAWASTSPTAPHKDITSGAPRHRFDLAAHAMHRDPGNAAAGDAYGHPPLPPGVKLRMRTSMDGSDKLADPSCRPPVTALIAADWLVPSVNFASKLHSHAGHACGTDQAAAATQDEQMREAHECEIAEVSTLRIRDCVQPASDVHAPHCEHVTASHAWNMHGSPNRKRSYEDAMHADRQPSACGGVCDPNVASACATNCKRRSDTKEDNHAQTDGKSAEVAAQLMVTACGHSDDSSQAWARLVAITLCAAPQHEVCAALSHSGRDDEDAYTHGDHVQPWTLCNVFATEAMPTKPHSIKAQGTAGAASSMPSAAQRSMMRQISSSNTPFTTLPASRRDPNIPEASEAVQINPTQCSAVATGRSSPVDALDIMGNSCYNAAAAQGAGHSVNVPEESLPHYSPLCITSSTRGTVTVSVPSGSLMTFTPHTSHPHCESPSDACGLKEYVAARMHSMHAAWPPAQVYECQAVHAYLPRLSCIQSRSPVMEESRSLHGRDVSGQRIGFPNALLAGTKDGRVLSVTTSAQLHFRDRVTIPSVVHALHACGASALRLSSAMHSQVLLTPAATEFQQCMRSMRTPGSHSVMHSAHASLQATRELGSSVFQSCVEQSQNLDSHEMHGMHDMELDDSAAHVACEARHSTSRLLPVFSGACLASCAVPLVTEHCCELDAHARVYGEAPASMDKYPSASPAGASVPCTASLFLCSRKLEFALFDSLSGVATPSSDSALESDAFGAQSQRNLGEDFDAEASVEAFMPRGTCMHVLWCPALNESVFAAAASQGSLNYPKSKTQNGQKVPHEQNPMPTVSEQSEGPSRMSFENVPESSETDASVLGQRVVSSSAGCAAVAALVASENACHASLVLWCVSTGGVMHASTGADNNGDQAGQGLNTTRMRGMHEAADVASGTQLLGSGIGEPRSGAQKVVHACGEGNIAQVCLCSALWSLRTC